MSDFWFGYTQTPGVTPRLYEIMQSLVNTPDGSTNPYNLAAAARSSIFDFSYTLSNEVDKEEFETNILEYFMMRRIGFETYTLWHIKFRNRIHTIMPKYNAMFDYQAKAAAAFISAAGKSSTTTHNYGNTSTITKNLTDEITYGSTVTGSNSVDSRQSDTPQNAIQDVKDGTYLSNYNFDESESSTTNSGKDSTAHTGTDTTSHTGVDIDSYVETLSGPEKTEFYKNYMESIQNIYTMIYKDLDGLFSIF